MQLQQYYAQYQGAAPHHPGHAPFHAQGPGGPPPMQQPYQYQGYGPPPQQPGYQVEVCKAVMNSVNLKILSGTNCQVNSAQRELRELTCIFIPIIHKIWIV